MKADATLLDWSAAARPQKDRARRYLFHGLGFATYSIWMPAAECLDIKLALDLGVLDRAQSRIMCVEDDPGVIPGMVRTIEELGFTHEPLILHRSLYKVHIPWPRVDFAFLDFCGTFTRETLLWMNDELATRLTNLSAVATSCVYDLRNSEFLRDSRRVFVERWPELYEHFIEEHAYYDRHHDRRAHEPFDTPAILLKCAFHEFDYITRKPFPYRDGSKMIGFRLNDFRSSRDHIFPVIRAVLEAITPEERVAPEPAPEPPPLFVEEPPPPLFVEDEMEEDELSTASDAETKTVPEAKIEHKAPSKFVRRSSAALKAWQTRRTKGWVHPRKRK